MTDKTLSQNPERIAKLNRQFRQREAELENYYGQHGEALVLEMKKTGYEFTENGGQTAATIKRNQAKFAKFDPEIQYNLPVKPIVSRPGRDSVDNAALLP